MRINKLTSKSQQITNDEKIMVLSVIWLAVVFCYIGYISDRNRS